MVQEILQLDTGDSIAQSCGFDKTNKQVVVGCSDGLIKVVDLEKGDVASTMKGHEGSVNAVVVNQDNSFVYSAGSDGTLRQWK